MINSMLLMMLLLYFYDTLLSLYCIAVSTNKKPIRFSKPNKPHLIVKLGYYLTLSDLIYLPIYSKLQNLELF